MLFRQLNKPDRRPKLSEGDDALRSLESRMAMMLPPRFQCASRVSTTSMGSAKLKYDADGRVAWDDLWTHFCDLAIAGGPPHRGTLLEPASPADIDASPTGYQTVVKEIQRAGNLVTGLTLAPVEPGWVAVQCPPTMAAWLQRAMVAENILARHKDTTLLIPAGPHFRIEKEVKNVITALAKTFHDWADHLSNEQKDSFAATIRELPADHLLEPALSFESSADLAPVARALAAPLQRDFGIVANRDAYRTWLAVPCEDDRIAAWLVRSLVVDHVLARRENDVVFVPLHKRFAHNNGVARIGASLANALRCWQLKPRQ